MGLVGGWVGGEPWQSEKWSTGLAFIWAAYWDWQEWMMTPSSSIANHNLHLNLHFSQVHCSNCLLSSFYHLVERVHDAWAACFDLFHLIGPALPRINQRAGIYQVNLNSWHQKMIYILHTYQRYNFSHLIIGKYIGSLKCFEIRANYSKPTDPIDWQFLQCNAGDICTSKIRACIEHPPPSPKVRLSQRHSQT